MTVTPTDAQSVLAEARRRPTGSSSSRSSSPSPTSTGSAFRCGDPRDEARPLLFVKQKKMKIREDIRFRLSPDDEAHVFMIKGKTVFEFRGRHDVLDAQENPIGLLEKTFGRSLLRSHWRVRDPEGNELLDAQESNLIVALVRRLAGLLPEWLSLLSWIPFNFELRREGKQVGSYKRILGPLRDRYVSAPQPEEARPGRSPPARRFHRCPGRAPGSLALPLEIGV